MRIRRILAVLLLALALAPPPSSAQAPAEPEWQVLDGAGDQRVIGPAPAPPTPVTTHADLARIAIEGENEVGFYFVLQVQRLRVAPQAGDCCVEDADFFVTFGLAGRGVDYFLDIELRGALEADGQSTFLADPGASRVEFTVCDEDACLDQPVELELGKTENTVRVWVPKESLLGLGRAADFQERPRDLPPTLRAGDRLDEIGVRAHYNLPFLFDLVDFAPEPGVDADPYVFRTGTANTLIRATIGDGTGETGILPGRNQTISIGLKNLQSVRRIVLLQYELEGAPEAVAHYSVTGPRNLTVPAGDRRNITVALNASAEAAEAPPVRLVVRGQSAGRPDELAYAAARLMAGDVLGPEQNLLHFHATARGVWGEPIDGALCPLPLPVARCGMGFLSPRAQHPDADPDVGIDSFAFGGPDGLEQIFRVATKRRTAEPLALDPTRPLEAVLVLRAPVDAPDVHVTVALDYDGEEAGGTLFQAQQTTTVTPAGTPVTFSGPVRLPQNRNNESLLPPGIDFVFRVETTTLSPGGTAAWTAGGLEIRTSGSQIALPLKELPEELRRGAQASPFQLLVNGSREDLVNPGESRLFNLTILNQDAAPQRAVVDATVEPDAWGVSILPGTTFDLGPGETATVGVLVRAPASAPENEQATARVNVSAPNGAVTGARFVVVATEYDVGDDANAYQADNETAARLVAPHGGNTPAFEAAALAVGALVALLGVGRRRRGAAATNAH